LDALIEFTFTHFTREERTMAASGYLQSLTMRPKHQAMQKAPLESLRQVAKGRLEIPVFLGHLKESFTCHFERDDMTFITWQRSNPGKSARETASPGADSPRN
jgi:hemerythrin